jgi:hypothetical protein
MRIALSPLRTQYPSASQALNPATNVASGQESATSNWLLSDSRARPPHARTRTHRCQPSEASSCWAAWWRRSRSAARRSPRSWLLSLRRLVVAIGYLMCRWPARVAGRSPTLRARRAQNLGGDGPSPGPQPDCHESFKQAPDDLRFDGSPPAGRRIGCRTFTRRRARVWRGAQLTTCGLRVALFVGPRASSPRPRGPPIIPIPSRP